MNAPQIISSEELSVRTENVLLAHFGPDWKVGQITSLTRQQFRKIRGIGSKAVKEVAEVLADHGLAFKRETPGALPGVPVYKGRSQRLSRLRQSGDLLINVPPPGGVVAVDLEDVLIEAVLCFGPGDVLKTLAAVLEDDLTPGLLGHADTESEADAAHAKEAARRLDDLAAWFDKEWSGK